MPRAFLIKKKQTASIGSPRSSSPKLFSPSSSGIGSPNSSSASTASSSPRNDENDPDNRFQIPSPRYSFKKEDNQGLDLSMKNLLKETNTYSQKSPKRDFSTSLYNQESSFVSSYPYPAKFAKIADFLRNGETSKPAPLNTPTSYEPEVLKYSSSVSKSTQASQCKPLNFSVAESQNYRLPPYSINWSEHFSVNKLVSPTPSSQASDDSGRGSVHSEDISVDKSTDSESNKSRHSKKAERYQCPDCNKSYSTQSGLVKHQEFLCTTQVKKSFSCKHCDKVYVSLGALKMHIRTHTLPCKCKLCGKAFSRPWLLQGHIRTHTGEKPFACQFCNRAFADRSNLRAHLQTHSVVKKYSCKTCSRTFSRMSLLLKHEDNGCNSSSRLLSSPESSIPLVPIQV